MLKWTVVGTVLQTAMVVVGHQVAAVANLFGPLGVTISLIVGLLWAREAAEGWGHAAWGGAVVGGVAALLGIAVSFLLGDVGAVILAFGTLSSAVTGALGGLLGRRLRPAAAVVAALAAASLGTPPPSAAQEAGPGVPAASATAVAGPAAAGAAAPESSPSEGLDAFGWLAGTWRGEGPDGATAEIHFMPPEAGVLPAVFRLWKGERTIVLEALTLVREADRVVMYVRHFDPALVPMEKERAIELVLVRREGDAFIFENANEGQNPRRSTMWRAPDGFTSVSELVRSDGTTAEIRATYRRAPRG